MSSNGEAGRIDRTAFVASVLALFVLAMISSAIRFLMRIIGPPKSRRFAIDDGFLCFGLACLICSVAILFVFIDDAYLVEALQSGQTLSEEDLFSDVLGRSWDFQKWAVICLIVLWQSITAVKFSYLFLFRKLIDRIHPMVLYWRVVVAYTLVTWAFGIAAYIVPCPYFYSLKSLQCSQGSGVNKTILISSISQALDVFGDFLILAIPVRLIWQIRIPWTQKVALGFSLCLTVVLIAVTLARASGLRNHDVIDVVWETYWQFLSAEVGLILTAMTAFRSLFVVNRKDWTWYSKSKKFLKGAVSPRSWRSKNTSESSGEAWPSRDEGLRDLPDIPAATMTGLRSFIDGRGKSTFDASRVLESQSTGETTLTEDPWFLPLRGNIDSRAPQIYNRQ
ncbi:MAG: hypothetical protein M1817_006787 [Caeruleum heppii]|nr:MAG: hypothetical protein M1817_006787 [Caeruleum heppii]